MKKVTILLPNYNNEPYIKQCLDSINIQSYADFEILIIDDGSTDNSVKIIKEYKDDRIRLIEKKENSGIIDTLNLGIKQSSSEYIVRMDGDDHIHKDRIKKLVQFMEAHPKIGVCGSGIKHFGTSNDVIIYNENQKTNSANLIFGHSIGHASVIYRTNVLLDNNIQYSNGYNYIEDYKIFLDLDKVTTMTSIPDILYYYRREEYNNFKNLDVKNKGFLKIYASILTQLGMPASKRSTQIHFELGNNTLLSERKKMYKRHIKALKAANKKNNIFPKKELETVLDKKFEKLFYRLVDQSRLNIFEGLEFFIKSPKKLYYYFKSFK